MDVRVLSWYMLLPQIAATGFLISVMARQISLFKLEIQEDLINFRRWLFVWSVSVLFLVAVLLVVDVGTILGLITRSTQYINPVGIMITLVYNAALFLAAIVIWMLYRMAGRILLSGSSDQATKNHDTGIE